MAPLHVVAFPMPMTGHANALMHLCVRLAAQDAHGFRFSFLCTQETEANAIRTRDMASSSAEEVQSISIVVIGSCLTQSIFRFPERAPALLEQHLQRLSLGDDLPHCILADTFLSCIQPVADRFAIPWGAVWTSNAISDVTLRYTPQLLEGGFVPFTRCEHKDRLIDFLPGIPPIRGVDLPLILHTDTDEFAELLPVFVDMSARFKLAKFALCNTVEELEPDMVAMIRKEMKSDYFCVGPCISSDFLEDKPLKAVLSAEDEACLEWLGKQADSSVLYVSFGSLFTIHEEQVEQIIQGLEAAGFPFLLVIRRNLSFFSSILDKARQRSGSNCLVVSWAPQLQVLSHPSVRGFFTHCGWNSTLEAVCAGVPMLALPLSAEQNINAREMVVKLWNVGVELIKGDGDIVSAADVADGVRRLMNTEDFRKNARELRAKVKAALRERGSSSENLRAFAQALKSRKWS